MCVYVYVYIYVCVYVYVYVYIHIHMQCAKDTSSKACFAEEGSLQSGVPFTWTNLTQVSKSPSMCSVCVCVCIYTYPDRIQVHDFPALWLIQVGQKSLVVVFGSQRHCTSSYARILFDIYHMYNVVDSCFTGWDQRKNRSSACTFETRAHTAGLRWNAQRVAG
jgi:hypothetical protein